MSWEECIHVRPSCRMNTMTLRKWQLCCCLHALEWVSARHVNLQSEALSARHQTTALQLNQLRWPSVPTGLNFECLSRKNTRSLGMLKSLKCPELWTPYQKEICPDLTSQCVAADQNAVDPIIPITNLLSSEMRSVELNMHQIHFWPCCQHCGNLQRYPRPPSHTSSSSSVSSAPRKVSRISIIDLWSPYNQFIYHTAPTCCSAGIATITHCHRDAMSLG